jgi:thioredoxin 1
LRFANHSNLIGVLDRPVLHRAPSKEPDMPTTITDGSFDHDVLKSAAPVVVDFWAEWCPPCHAIAPALDELASELAGKVTIAKLNVDENPAAAARYGVRSIPTLIIFKNGEPAAMQIGAAPKARLSDWIRKAI